MNRESSRRLHIKGVDGGEIHLLVDFSGQMLTCWNNRFNVDSQPWKIFDAFQNKNTWRTAQDLYGARSGLIQLKSKCLRNSSRTAPTDTLLCSYTQAPTLQMSISLSGPALKCCCSFQTQRLFILQSNCKEAVPTTFSLVPLPFPDTTEITNNFTCDARDALSSQHGKKI